MAWAAQRVSPRKRVPDVTFVNDIPVVQIERRIKPAGVNSVRAAAVLPAAQTPVNRTSALRMRRFKVRGVRDGDRGRTPPLTTPLPCAGWLISVVAWFVA
jgi:hypothetical protein